ncbi:amino acid permease [Pontiellaceae bacterium B1224]|nr:amino acid permease [Pontiellaceae bacterium B1224]
MKSNNGKKLKKELGTVQVFTLAAGAMIGSGLFILPGMAHAQAGTGVILSYLFAGLLAATATLSLAELATAMPKAGSDYFFITRGFGAGTGSVAGILSWFALALKSAFAIVGMATFIALFLDAPALLSGAILTVFFVVLNILGVRQAAQFQTVLVFGMIILLLLYAAAGIPKINAELLTPFVPHGAAGIFSTAGFVFVSYGGLLKIASVAEEIDNPGKCLPLGLGLALVCVTALYALTIFVTSGVMEDDVFNESRIPLSDGGRAIAGSAGFIAMSVCAILAFISTANAGIMASSRYLLALSRDNLLPEPLGRVSKKTQTPVIAIAITGGLILLSLLLELSLLVKAASCVLILSYMLCCLAVVILRESGLQNYRPIFTAPGYPWVQVAGVLGLTFVLFELAIEAFLISAVLILFAFLIFWFYGRKQMHQESALLHLITRLTDRELTEGELEEELKEIIRERDDIKQDQFDRLVESAPVLHYEEAVTKDKLFADAAEKLAPLLDMDGEDLAKGLEKREAENSTVLNPFLAVSHVIIEGTDKFELLLARAPEGVKFSDETPSVHAVFVLVGSVDQRNAHLRALFAIARITQAEEFEAAWLEADDDQILRDLILLSDRRRARRKSKLNR